MNSLDFGFIKTKPKGNSPKKFFEFKLRDKIFRKKLNKVENVLLPVPK